MKKLIIASLIVLAFWSCENQTAANSNGIKNISKPGFAESAPKDGGEKEKTVVVVVVPKGGVNEEKIFTLINNTNSPLTLVDYSGRDVQFFTLETGSAIKVLSFETSLSYTFDERTNTYYLYE
jgi:hypothetical protein